MASFCRTLRIHHHSRNYLQDYNSIISMKNKPNQNLYSQMHRFAEVTKTLIITGNIDRAKKCLQKAEELFNTGTSEIKNAIANVYVFSVTTFMERHHCNIRNLFPESLQSEYQKQVISSYP